jgi:hypothetical protein
MTFWDYATGTPFQNMEDIPQPGSLEAEAGIFCSTFDMTGTRLITGGADKTIKVRVNPFYAGCEPLLTMWLSQGVRRTNFMIDLLSCLCVLCNCPHPRVSRNQ